VQRQPARLLSAAVGLVLAIACANVAGLLLARGLRRRKEIAVRMSLGASRRRIVRQLVTESLLLGAAGGLAGIIVSYWAKDLLLAFYTVTDEGQRAYFTLDPDPLVLLFTCAVSLAAGVVFGLVPALHATRADVWPTLKSEGVSGPARTRARDVLVVGQLATSLVLLAGAGLLVRSLANVYAGPGFDPRPVLLVRLRPTLVAQTASQAKAFHAEVIRRLEAMPGVVAASPADFPPLPNWGGPVRAWLPGHEPPTREAAFRSANNSVGPRYFKTLGMALVEGRDFDERDRRGSPRVVIVNDTFARHFWPDGGAAGRAIVIDGLQYEVVGVARTADYHSALEAPRPFVYRNFWQRETIDTRAEDSRTHVRVAGDAARMLPAIKRAISGVDANVPISEDRPLTEWLDYAFGSARALRSMLLAFSAIAVFLSAIGLYGVLASTVSQRTREIAIRIALGAERSDVAALVVRHGTRLVAAGVVLGLAATIASARLVGSYLYGVETSDPITVAATTALLAAVAFAASGIPARRAARVDPMVALRYE
jgi:putative ABC transport system permease protein